MSEARVYDSPLRAEQMEYTRRRILEAVAELLAAGGEVTVPAVARRARVAVRTVYRHFPTREALFDAWGDWAETNLDLQVHSYPETLEGLFEMIPSLYRSYDENEALVRAMLTEAGRPVRERTRRTRAKAFEKALEELTAELSSTARRRALAAVYLFASAPAWQAMRAQWGLDGVEAGRTARWAIRVLVDELRGNPTSIEEG